MPLNTGTQRTADGTPDEPADTTPDTPTSDAPEADDTAGAPADDTAGAPATGTATGTASAETEEPVAASETPDPAAAAPAPPPGRLRSSLTSLSTSPLTVARVLRRTVDVLAAVLVLGALLLPTRLGNLRAAEFARLPVEAVFGAAVLTLLPRRPRLVMASLAGVSLGALTVLNLLDMGFHELLGRGFDVVLDWVLLDDAQSYLEDSLGHSRAVVAAVAVVVLVVALIAVMALATVRLAGLLGRNGARTAPATLVFGTVWVLCAATGVRVAGVPVASEHTAGLVQDRVQRVRVTLKDEREFARTARIDTFGDTPGDRLLTGLRGKDVIFTFIESYGRSAVEDPIMAPGVDATLKAGTESLREAGFAAKSGWLTSATYGGSSWLGHSTFLSGLWIDNQNRYRTVTSGDHLTVTGAFKRTGAWRTVGIMPGVQKSWPEAKFYGLDHVYDSRELGYQGPKFSWSTMPDQYALTAFERLEHGRKHSKPLMSEIILTSSHQPWAPIPKMIDWDRVGDGSVYDGIEKAGKNPANVFYDSTRVRTEYGRSVQYSLNSLIQYVEKYGDKNTVLVFLGDHQPMARVSGEHASRDVPCAIVAHDPKVLDRIAGWGWSDGLRPAHDAPVWKMSDFRDRFLTAYGSTPSTPAPAPAPAPKN
ncbi:sulfatase [Streptomyces sp. NPDC008313]|uniref:sulfatase n=1 Tax=Streptomyces sp. NPDC008313 TaxID=3364826 RepID=UPI0036E0B4CC